MAITRTPGPQNASKYPFVGSNYQQYGEQPGYLYYPYNDSYYPDPKAQQQYAEQNGLVKKEPSKPGLAGQIGTGAAVLGTGVLVNEGVKAALANSFPSNSTKLAEAKAAQELASMNNQSSGTGMLSNRSPAAPTAPAATGDGMLPAKVNGSAPNSAGPEFNVSADGIATAPDGSAVNTQTGEVGLPDGTKVNTTTKEVTSADGTKVQGSQAIAALQTAGGVMQAYNGYQQYKGGQKLAGGANVAGGAFNAAAGAQALANGGAAGSLGGYVPYVGAAVAGAQIGQNVMNTEGNSEARAQQSQAEAAKAAMLFVPGYGWVAYAALAGLDAVSGGKATEQVVKHMGRVNKLTDKVDFGLGKKIRSKVFHQSTRGVAKEHSAQLASIAPEDATYQNYLGAMRGQYNEAPTDPTKPFAGKYKSWDEYKAAGLEASDLTGVYGNIKTYGPAWAALSQEEREAVTQANIDSGLYNSKKGEVEITDETKAKENFDNVLKDFKPSAPANQPSRSSTRSPGFDKDGRRLANPTQPQSTGMIRPRTPAKGNKRNQEL